MLHRCFAAAFISFVAIGLTAYAGPAQIQQGVPILVYHRFDPVNAGSTAITTPVFKLQVAWLEQHHYAVVPLRAVVDWLRGIGPAPQLRAVVITADDGNASVYTQQYPIILTLHILVTLFI